MKKQLRLKDIIRGIGTRNRGCLVTFFAFGMLMFVWMIWDDHRNKQRVGREKEFRGRMASIQLDMSEEKVIEILGPPTTTKNVDRKVGTWRSHHAGGFKSLDVPTELREKSVTRELKWKVGKSTLVIDFVESRVFASRTYYAKPYFRRG